MPMTALVVMGSTAMRTATALTLEPAMVTDMGMVHQTQKTITTGTRTTLTATA